MLRRGQKFLFILSVIAIAAGIIACEDKLAPPKTDLNTQDTPDQESWNSTVSFSDSANVVAILNAGYMGHYPGKGYIKIDSGAKVDFFKAGEIVSTLTGKNGIVLDSTKDIEIYDSVVVVNKEGSILTTDKLFWNNKEQKVYSDQFVHIKTPNEEIRGVGFESDQNLTNYKIYKVTGTFDK
jgi:LPS export ABC transporter protein LptC